MTELKGVCNGCFETVSLIRVHECPAEGALRRCMYCGLRIEHSAAHGWLHVEGYQWGRHRCQIGGNDAAPFPEEEQS